MFHLFGHNSSSRPIFPMSPGYVVRINMLERTYTYCSLLDPFEFRPKLGLLVEVWCGLFVPAALLRAVVPKSNSRNSRERFCCEYFRETLDISALFQILFQFEKVNFSTERRHDASVRRRSVRRQKEANKEPQSKPIKISPSLLPILPMQTSHPFNKKRDI